MARFEVGSLVRCRAREWVVVPSDAPDVLMLRPLGGVAAETCGIYLPLEGHAVEPASFAPPDPALAGDVVAGQLLRDAARLLVRSGAGPFRSLGQVGVRPRPYQLVPLLMALRLDPVRLLIADDVGIGKTIEAGLIARELLDRGEVRRLTVLCPPHLCEQWQRELATKFAIDAVVVRSSTAAGLERRLPRGDASLFEFYPFTVASIDYVKSERRRDSFLRACPELVIVDEAHTATDASGRGTQQQRYELVRALAAQGERHVVLLTATPHSGIEEAFRSLLALVNPAFAGVRMDALSERERDVLARHFVQRRRADVQRWLGAQDVTPFPQRETQEVTYSLPRASAYRQLFQDVYAFTRELVRAGDGDAQVWRQRARYWAALALLRCVMSSPAAAERALRGRAEVLDADGVEPDAADIDALFRQYVYDPTDQEGALDVEPAQAVAQGSPRSERERLNQFARQAALLHGDGDVKLLRLLPVLEGLLRDGFRPIVYCRYIATANYVAGEVARRVREVRALAVTGERSEEEREALIADLERSPRRVLVATDCLSEGINLQHAFDAVVHYDLPWNPNRLEQREGRVDRYGQASPVVRTVLLYGQDNPMDEAVMTVLLRKAARIHQSLGISVPLPLDSTTVVETLIASLFTPAPRQESMFDAGEQASLFAADGGLAVVEQAWDRAVERERESRTRFAQRRIKPDEVARELDEVDAALGDAAAVERFVRAACERLHAPLVPERDYWLLPTGHLPLPVRERFAPLLAQVRKGRDAELLPLTFAASAPQGVAAVGRHHVVTVALAEYMLDSALMPEAHALGATRCGVSRSQAVTRRTVVLVLRVRMLVRGARQESPGLAEELVVCGYTGSNPVQWLDQAAALALLEQALPSQNVTFDERRHAIVRALEQVEALAAHLREVAQGRAERLRESHARVRAALGSGSVSVTPHMPPDVLGVYVVLPVMSGV